MVRGIWPAVDLVLGCLSNFQAWFSNAYRRASEEGATYAVARQSVWGEAGSLQILGLEYGYAA